tara:strand:+ start:587 stop:1252 length:666 start_codon:yes stop_codon:yes gene_type:complete
MNLKRELQKMNISDLRAVCRELGVSCPTTKSGIIKRLLFPLKKKYKMPEFPDPAKKNIAGFIGTSRFVHGEDAVNEKFMEEVIRGDERFVDMYGNFGANPNERFINYSRDNVPTYPIVESAKRGNVHMVKHLLNNYDIDLYDKEHNFAIGLSGRRMRYIGDYITELLRHKIKNSRRRGSYEHSKMSRKWKEIIKIIESKQLGKERDDRRRKRQRQKYDKTI